MQDQAIARLHDLGFRHRKRPAGGGAFDHVLDDSHRRYAVAVKSLRDVRAGQVDGVLADTYLKLRASAYGSLVPMVVLVVPKWSASMTQHVLDYRGRYLGDCG